MADSTVWWLLAGAAVAVELLTGTFYLLMLAIGWRPAPWRRMPAPAWPPSWWWLPWSAAARWRPGTRASGGPPSGPPLPRQPT
jgi:hypothetical protein